MACPAGTSRPHASAVLGWKAQYSLDEATISADQHQHCCQRRCLLNFSPNELYDLREFYANLGDEKAKLQWLMHRARERGELRNDDAAPMFSIKGKRVCARAFLLAYHISGHKYYHALSLAHTGVSAGGLVHGRAGAGEPWEPGALAQSWMSDFFQRHCDVTAPDRWVMPTADDFHSLYELYVADLQLHALGSAVSPASFQRIRAEHFPMVVRARVGDLARCNKCVQLRELRAMAKTSADQHRAAEKLAEHRALNAQERQLMTFTSLRAKTQRDVIHLHVDYGSSVALPHYAQRPKSMERLHGLDLNVAGTFDSGTTECFLYFHLNKIAKDPNAIITMLSLHLLSLVRRGLLPGAAPGLRTSALAPELVLQGDNAWSQLKNQHVIAFAAMLVAHGFFSSIRLQFMLQGHTHGPLDQRFGVFSNSLKHASLHDLHDLIAHVAARCPSITAPVVLEGVLDFKRWLQPHAYTLTGHTGMVDGVATGGPHAYHIYLADDQPVMEYCDFPGAPEPVWRGNGGVERGAARFQPIRLLRSLPEGVPARATTIWLATEAQAREASVFAHFQHDLLQLAPGIGEGAATVDEVRWRFDVLHTGTLQVQAAPSQPQPVIADAGIVRKARHPDVVVPVFDGNIVPIADAFWAPLRERANHIKPASDAAAAGAHDHLGASKLHTVVVSSGNSSGRGKSRMKQPRTSRRRDGFDDEDADPEESDSEGSSPDSKREPSFEINSLLAHRDDKQHAGGFEYLVDWKDYPAMDTSWQPEDNIDPSAIADYWRRLGQHAPPGHSAYAGVDAAVGPPADSAEPAAAAAAPAAFAAFAAAAPPEPPHIVGQGVPGHQVVQAAEPAADVVMQRVEPPAGGGDGSAGREEPARRSQRKRTRTALGAEMDLQMIESRERAEQLEESSAQPEAAMEPPAKRRKDDKGNTIGVGSSRGLRVAKPRQARKARPKPG